MKTYFQNIWRQLMYCSCEYINIIIELNAFLFSILIFFSTQLIRGVNCITSLLGGQFITSIINVSINTDAFIIDLNKITFYYAIKISIYILAVYATCSLPYKETPPSPVNIGSNYSMHDKSSSIIIALNILLARKYSRWLSAQNNANYARFWGTQNIKDRGYIYHDKFCLTTKHM